MNKENRRKENRKEVVCEEKKKEEQKEECIYVCLEKNEGERESNVCVFFIILSFLGANDTKKERSKGRRTK